MAKEEQTKTELCMDKKEVKEMKHSDEDYLIENKCEKDFEEYSDYMDINLSNEQISCYCSPSCTLSELPHPNFSLEK